MRVVASLTTMPDNKYEKVVKTLQSLHNQTYKLDAIYLAVPKISRRLKIQYPPIPKSISDLCTIVDCGEDYGPITKIAGGLLSEQDPDTVIITFDDDMVYPHNLVECLVNHHKRYPDEAIGSSGMLVKYLCPACAIVPNENNPVFRIPKFKIPKEGRRVDSIYGYPGALYVRKFFPKVENLYEEFYKYALINTDTLMNDDITISGYLSLKNIGRRIFADMPEVKHVILDETTGDRQRNQNEISSNMDKFFQRMNNAIVECKRIGMYQTLEELDISETIIGVSSIIVICVIIILFIVWIIWASGNIPDVTYYV